MSSLACDCLSHCLHFCLSFYLFFLACGICVIPSDSVNEIRHSYWISQPRKYNSFTFDNIVISLFSPPLFSLPLPLFNSLSPPLSLSLSLFLSLSLIHPLPPLSLSPSLSLSLPLPSLYFTHAPSILLNNFINKKPSIEVTLLSLQPLKFFFLNTHFTPPPFFSFPAFVIRPLPRTHTHTLIQFFFLPPYSHSIHTNRITMAPLSGSMSLTHNLCPSFYLSIVRTIVQLGRNQRL